MDESATELVRDWLTRASHDLRAARILAAVDNPLLDSAIYHCQQFMLETIGFTWNAEATDLKWREMFSRLKEYHAEHADADVPGRWENDLKLAAWVSHQRERGKRDTLSHEETTLLDSLGFAWKSRDVGTWEDRLAEVAAFIRIRVYPRSSAVPHFAACSFPCGKLPSVDRINVAGETLT